jgi:hypothetical protein
MQWCITILILVQHVSYHKDKTRCSYQCINLSTTTYHGFDDSDVATTARIVQSTNKNMSERTTDERDIYLLSCLSRANTKTSPPCAK